MTQHTTDGGAETRGKGGQEKSSADDTAQRQQQEQACTVAIIGTGFGGLGTAIRLRKAGITDFIVFEKSDSVGGTWRDNTYPGAGCDVPSHLYSFSFETNPDWSRRYSGQDEILTYLEHCAEKYGIRPHIRFRTAVESATWDETTGSWILQTCGGTVRARFLITACGQLSRPIEPDIPGLKDFPGTVFHSARWNHDCDLRGKRIGVIGSGASAIQFVPEIARDAANLYSFQRSPAWIVPKDDRAYEGFEKWALSRLTGWRRLHRAWLYWQLELRFLTFSSGTWLSRKARQIAEANIRQEVADAELRAKVTPDYDLGCKRILISNEYYKTLQRPNVEVLTGGVQAVEGNTLVSASGERREVDVIILATGFDATSFLAPLKVTGQGGLPLAKAWAGGAEAYLGITVPKFPNFFMLWGPNTNLGHNSIIFMIENQLRYILGCIRSVLPDPSGWIDVRQDVSDEYNRALQEDLRTSVWNNDCGSWYKNAEGKITTNWPRFTVRYWWDTRRPSLEDYTIENARP